MAQVQNIVIEQGSTFETELTVSDVNNAVMDLTLYSARSTIRKSHSSVTGIDFPATVLSPKNTGVVKLSLTPTQSRAIKAGRYVYDVEVYTTADADVVRIVEGLITVSPGTYRP